LDPTMISAIEADLASSNEDRRWQAAIRLGEHVEAEPEAVWAVAARWGASADGDKRAAIATCVLEHLLEHHFELLFPRIERLASADPRFADTVSSCWRFGQSAEPANAKRLEDLQARLRSHGAA
jgi:Family of unknown function (DUF6869)